MSKTEKKVDVLGLTPRWMCEILVAQNPGQVTIVEKKRTYDQKTYPVLVTETDPKELRLPEGFGLIETTAGVELTNSLDPYVLGETIPFFTHQGARWK